MDAFVTTIVIILVTLIFIEKIFSIPEFNLLFWRMAEGGEATQNWGLRSFFGKPPTKADEDAKAPGAHESKGRYKYDLEQARLIQRGLNKPQQKTQLTEEDVLLGLKGLDQADSFREQGDYQKSLKMSEMAMELLIQFLKAEPSVMPGINRETILQRVQCALTNAEELKRNIAARKVSAKTSSPSSRSVPSTATSQALSEALSGAVCKIQKASSGQTAGQSTASSRRQTAPQHQQSSPSSQQRAASQVSRFYNSQDPMVQTIKSELYVDHSQLQKVSWDDIAGLETAKQTLQENAILPLVRPDLFTGLRRPRNILLYGPPGTGKTLLVKAVAKESNCILFICTASTLTSKWHGEGEKLLRTLFQVARTAAPSIIFVDEMDALLSSRRSEGEHEASRRFKTEFMTQVDGIVQDGHGTKANEEGKHLLLIACTNCPWDIDPAVMRRFPRRIYIPLPDSRARKELLKGLLWKAGKHDLSSADLKSIVKRLSGFSGSDIASVASEASFGPIRSLGGIEAIRGAAASEIRPISMDDFNNAVAQATKSVGRKQLQQYDDWAREQAAS